jgi:hypothetical protein
MRPRRPFYALSHNDAGESAYIRSIDVAQNDDALGRLCSYLTLVHGR